MNLGIEATKTKKRQRSNVLEKVFQKASRNLLPVLQEKKEKKRGEKSKQSMKNENFRKTLSRARYESLFQMSIFRGS